MKKFSFKSIAFLMSLIMVFSIFAPVIASAAEWAHDDHDHKKDGPINYVSLGDSMTNGYGLPGYDGNGGVLDYADAAYPNEFASWLAGNGEVNNMPSFVKAADKDYAVNHYQLGMSASRVADIHWLLTLDYEDQDVIDYLDSDSYNPDEWYAEFTNGDAWIAPELLGRRMNNAAHQIAYANGDLNVEIQDCETAWDGEGNCDCFTAGQAAKIVAEYYQNAIAEADIISFGFGNGDFGVFMMNLITWALSNKISDVMVFETDKLLLELTEQEKSAVMDVVNEVKDTLDLTIDKYFGSALDTEEKREALEVAIVYSTVSFAVNYANVIKDVLKVNPDVEIIQLGLMNTYARDAAVEGDTTIGQILDIIFPPINSYIAALPVALKATNPAYKDARFYYAEEYTVECVLHTFGNEDFYAFNGVARQRFVEWMESELWNLIYVSLFSANILDGGANPTWNLLQDGRGTYDDIFPFFDWNIEAERELLLDYLSMTDAEKVAFYTESDANAAAATKIEIYLAYEKAIADAGLERPVTLGTLMDASATLQAIQEEIYANLGGLGSFNPVSAQNIIDAVEPVFGSFLGFDFTAPELADDDNRAYQAVADMAAAQALGVEFTVEDVKAIIALTTNAAKEDYIFSKIEDNVDMEKLVATIPNYSTSRPTQVQQELTAMRGLMNAVKAVVTQDNVDAASRLFATSGDLYDTLMADEYVVGVLAVCARHRIGNGLGAHPSVQGHEDVAEEMINAYRDGHTSLDETLINLGNYSDLAYKKIFANYGYKLNEVVAYIDAAIADINAAYDFVDAYDVDDKLSDNKALLLEELANTVDTLTTIKETIESLEGNSADYAKVMRAVLDLEDDLNTHLATIKALVAEGGYDIDPYLIKINDAFMFYAAVIDEIVAMAYDYADKVVDTVTGINDAYLGFVEYVGSVADMLSPSIGKAVREYLIDTPADVFAIVYAYGEEAVLKLITDATNASGEIFDVALGFAALLKEYGEDVSYIVTNTAEFKALMAELNKTNGQIEEAYRALAADDALRAEIAELEAELAAIKMEVLSKPVSTSYDVKIAEINAAIEALVADLTFATEEDARMVISSLEAKANDLYVAIFNLYMETAADVSPFFADAFKDSIAALLECLGIIGNAEAEYAAWLIEHFEPMAGEILASVLNDTLDLLDVMIPGIKAIILAFIEDVEKEIAEIKAEIEELYEALVELNSELNRLYNKLAELYVKLEIAVGEAKEAILAEIENVKAEIEKIKADIEEALKALNPLEGYLKELEALIADKDNYLEALDAIIVKLVGDIVEVIKPSLDTDYNRDEDSYYVAIGGNALNAEGNYAELLAEKLGVPAAVLGADLRVSDLLAILDAEYVNDAYGTALIDAETRELIAAYYAAEIEAADLITLEFGNADFTTFVTTQLLGYVVETNKAELAPFATIMGLDLDVFKAYDLDWTRFADVDKYVDVDAVLAEIEKVIIAQGIPAEYVYTTTLSDLTGVDWTIIFPDDTVELTVFPADMVMYAVECYLYSAVNYAYNLAAAIEAVHALNPDAEVVVLGTFNALEGLVIDLDGEVLNVSDFADKAVAGINAYTLATVVSMDKTTYVDIPAVETIIEADGEVTLDEFISIEALGFNPDAFAPSAAGNAYIAEQIFNALRLTCAHVYDNACDAECNICGEGREVADHVYENDCDATCDICGAEREVGEHKYANDCDATCDICGAERTVGAHKYANDCDKTCDICGAERTVGAHKYANDCDKTCDICGAERTVGEHKYANACDADCDICGATRTPADHKYTNDCDADCDVCGATRTPADHKYANDCDADCDVCGATRTPADHKYDNSCDKDCNVCGAERAVDGHLFGEWVTVEEATADKEGLKKHTCSECGFEETESIAKLAPQTTEPGTDDDEGMPVAVIVIIVVVGVAAVGTGAFFVLKKFSII